jgi:hypothetical protein
MLISAMGAFGWLAISAANAAREAQRRAALTPDERDMEDAKSAARDNLMARYRSRQISGAQVTAENVEIILGRHPEVREYLANRAHDKVD